jgi:N-acyl-D-amino-acid deacylase
MSFTRIPRRAFLAAILTAVATRTALAAEEASLAAFDDVMATFLKTERPPGAELAVAKDGHLVYARGFGVTAYQGTEAVQPSALFRIASISKPITAVAILQLIERGKLGLDTRVWEVLRLPEPSDRRWKRVTILHLLQHTGGWDRDVTFDPMFRAADVARALRVPPPIAPAQVIRYMLGQPLDFDPGRRFAYSNFGYCLLGRVIETVSGAAYEAHVQHEVLAPLGITRMRLGKTLSSERAAGEVEYHDEQNRVGPAVTGVVGTRVPLPYGTWPLEAMDSHAGWLASAVDLVRFACAFDVPERCRILTPHTIETMFARPEGLAGYDESGKPRPVYYACGWNVRTLQARGRVNAWHTGSFSGTSTLLVRRFDGKNWAVLFNMRRARDGRRLSDVIDSLMHRAIDRVTRWPETDLFPRLL